MCGGLKDRERKSPDQICALYAVMGHSECTLMNYLLNILYYKQMGKVSELFFGQLCFGHFDVQTSEKNVKVRVVWFLSKINYL